MKHTIVLIVALIGISTVSFGQDSKKADSSMVRSKSTVIKSSNTGSSSSEVRIEGESKSSGVVKPEPVIIYRDEEKILVKPN